MKFEKNLHNDSDVASLYIRSEKPIGNLKLAKEIILHEYSKYPRVIQKSQLEIVNLVSKLKVKNNADIDKFVDISTTYDAESKWIYINVDYLSDENYFKLGINHEIWHLYDCTVNGSVAPELPEWVQLNPDDFHYGDGGWAAYHSEFENEFHPFEGFITKYSALGIEEDRAELFMFYFTDYLRPKLERVLKEDKILRNKLKLLMDDINE